MPYRTSSTLSQQLQGWKMNRNSYSKKPQRSKMNSSSFSLNYHWLKDCSTIVITRYNNRTYRIDDIDWNKCPTGNPLYG